MEKKQTYLFAIVLTIIGSVTLSGCSSSEVTNNGEVTADELPVVDAQTDALPNTIDQPVASGSAPTEAATADGLAPEASVDMPAAAQPPSTVAEAPAPADAPASSPSVDAPPSMNEKAPVATAKEPRSSGGGNELYEVQSGDTLMKIAFKVYGDVYQWRKILDTNTDRISDPARLVKGTQLRVDNAPSEAYYEGFERYLIKSGDTLGYIAGDVYGAKSKWKALWKMNDGLVKDPNRIYAGFFLRYTVTEEDRKNSERAKSTPLAADTPAAEPAVTESGDQAVRNPSSFQEAKVPATPTTATQ